MSGLMSEEEMDKKLDALAKVVISGYLKESKKWERRIKIAFTVLWAVVGVTVALTAGLRILEFIR